MENQTTVLANDSTIEVIADLGLKPEPELRFGTGSIRRHATLCDLKVLVEIIAGDEKLQVQLEHEVAAGRKQILKVQAASLLSVSCNPGTGALLTLKALVDAELARRAIDQIASV